MTNEEMVKIYQQTKDKEERNKLLTELTKNNMGMIHKRAWKHHNTKAFVKLISVSLEDLIQEGRIAIIVAANKWDENKGAAFITYAVYWIEEKMYRLLHKRIGDDEFREVSLQTPIGSEEDGLTMGDTMSDEDSFVYKKNPYDAVNDEIFYEQIRSQAEELMRRKLTLQQQVVLKMYVGWTAEPTTLEEIGETLSICASYASDIKYNACRKLRNTAWAREIKREFFKERTIRKFVSRHESFKDNERWESSSRGAEELIRALCGDGE